MSSYDDQLSEMRRMGLSIDGDNAYKRDLLDSIVGALVLGKQGTHQPPPGHWAELFWDMANAEGAQLERLLKERDALLAERDGLREDRDSQQRVCIAEMEKVNQLRAEAEALKKDAEHRAPLNEAIQRAAGELPNGWEIRLCVERDAGWVELYDPDGNDIEDFATDAERLDYTVIDALEHALQGEQP